MKLVKILSAVAMTVAGGTAMAQQLTAMEVAVAANACQDIGVIQSAEYLNDGRVQVVCARAGAAPSGQGLGVGVGALAGVVGLTIAVMATGSSSSNTVD